MQTDQQVIRQTDRQTDMQTDRQSDRDRQTDKEKEDERERARETGTERQQTGRKKERDRDTETETEREWTGHNYMQDSMHFVALLYFRLVVDVVNDCKTRCEKGRLINEKYCVYCYYYYQLQLSRVRINTYISFVRSDPPALKPQFQELKQRIYYH